MDINLSAFLFAPILKKVHNSSMKSFKDIIQKGGVAVIRTDTLYGIVGDAHNPQAVSRIYTIKKRNPLKASIVLVADYDQIKQFGIEMNNALKERLNQYWPGKVSVILPVKDTGNRTHHIHKGTGGIAFRIPDNDELRKVLREVGPLIAPSANPEGKAPARNLQEALDYFGDKVDYYEDGGEVTDNTPSKIIRISNTIDIETIRE